MFFPSFIFFYYFFLLRPCTAAIDVWIRQVGEGMPPNPGRGYSGLRATPSCRAPPSLLRLVDAYTVQPAGVVVPAERL